MNQHGTLAERFNQFIRRGMDLLRGRIAQINHDRVFLIHFPVVDPAAVRLLDGILNHIILLH